MHECYPEHWHTETDEENKKGGVSIERRKAGTKNKSPDGISLPIGLRFKR